jgi:hypothetical protein
MRSRLLTAAAVAAVAALTGCSNTPDPTAYTVSYRSKVRLPANGAKMTPDEFATQVNAADPVASIRCAPEDTPAFRDAATYLGGYTWRHPATIVKDASFPPLFKGHYESGGLFGSSESASADAAPSSAPVIERPDLVGVRGGVALFLSKQHGLMAVDTRQAGALRPSCSMQLPGEPKNFFFKGNELVVVVNGANGSPHAALMRFTVDGARFRFVDAVRLDHQSVTDARLFDETLVAYTTWSRPAAPAGHLQTRSSVAAEDSAPSAPTADRIGSKVVVVRWDEALGIDWQDSLLDDPADLDPALAPNAAQQYEKGQIVRERKSYAGFVSASDRYLVVPRNVERTVFDRYETVSYRVCTSYNPRAAQVESCSTQYERRDNPDYRAPSPSTGDYACDGKSLADCVKAAAPSVSQYVYAPTGQKCGTVWVGRCERYETRHSTYPVFTQESATELTIYRFENAGFVRFDDALAKLVEKPNAIAFERGPLTVPGRITTRNQIQFQNGHLYVLADNALQTMAVAGNSISYVSRLAVTVEAASGQPSIVFSDARAMVSAGHTYGGSSVSMLDLSVPSKPAPLRSFSMPGASTQLLLAGDGILGPGQVESQYGNVGRSLQKLTLFSREDGRELDNLLLGTEYDTFARSWMAPNDDQKIRVDQTGQRVFLPYSGRHHADDAAPVTHRLNISRVDAGRLVSERSFELNDDIVRTASIDDARALAFGTTAAYLVDRTSGEWAVSTVREVFVPFATYRLDDKDLYARVSRVGNKCSVTTHVGHAQIFGAEHLAEATIPCPEDESPTGFGSNVLFRRTQTGVHVGDDGRTLTPLDRDAVQAMIARIPTNKCWLSSGGGYDALDYLDDVPTSIKCN